MTVNPAARPSLGRALGELNRLVGKLHNQALADFDTDFPAWMLFILLAEQDGPITVAEVIEELDRRADLPGDETRRRLERSAAAGHIAYRPTDDPATAELTEAGRAYFATVYAHSRKTTDAAFQGIDPEELDVALKVALAAKERAAAVLAAAPVD